MKDRYSALFPTKLLQKSLNSTMLRLVRIIELMKNISIPVLFFQKKECCGCTACYSICPRAAISMNEDEEGFEYPRIDEKKCIRCGMCLKVCPVRTL